MLFVISFPLASLIFATILAFVFLKKKKIKTIESKVYLVMIISSIIDSFLVTLENSLVLGKTLSQVTSTVNFLLEVFNKIDVEMLSVICTCLLLYLTFITVENINKRKYIKYASIILLIGFIVTIFLDFSVISSNGILTVGGPFVIPVYTICGLSIVLSIIMILTHIKKITSKYFPIMFVLVDFVFSMILFILAPYLSVAICFSLTVVNYIIFFTIENPDIDLISDLRIARDKAIISEKAKSDFLSSMSHELKTPLNAIIGLTQDKSEKSVEEYEEDRDLINKSSLVLLDMVNNIINMNQLETNEIKLNIVEYNLQGIINELIGNASNRIGSKDINISFEIESGIPRVLLGDKDKIKEIVNNILTNAIKYTEKGYIKLTISSINNNKKTVEIVIECKDTGRGISEEQQQRLFTKFNRLESDKDSNIEGTGLGLSLTKEFVEMMNGTITVESELGKGSTFKIVIPQEIVEINSEETEIL